MPETKHTHAPWRVVAAPETMEIYGGLDVESYTAEELQNSEYAGDVRHIATISGDAEDQIPAADARLIAAAPELLEALEKIAKGAGPYSRDQLTFANNVIEYLTGVAKIAIAKADAPGGE